MLTVQEIQSMSFEKAVFGGYDMKTVDEFIEQITEDYAAMQKENAALKSKMKVLVDKIEEYKSVEDGMRRALVSAQNIAKETIDKSKADADKILNAAKNDAEAKLSVYQAKIEQEKSELSRIRQENAEFISKMTGYFEKQMRELVTISTSDVLVDDEIAELEEKSSDASEDGNNQSQGIGITRDFGDEPNSNENIAPQEANYTIPEDIRSYMEKQKSSNAGEGMQIKVMEVTLNEEKNREQVQSATRLFGNLKFGSEYHSEQD